MITYPVTLPCPQAKKHVATVADSIVRSDFDYDNQQEYLQKAALPFTFMITCTAAQVATFKAFWSDIYEGVQPFNADWLIHGDASTKNIRYTGSYKIKALGAALYEISADCEVL